MPAKTRDERDAAEDDQSMKNLMASARLAPDTKKNYRFKVREYLRATGSTGDQLVDSVRRSPKVFEKRFAEFLQEVGKKSSPSTVVGFRDSVKRFLEINRVGSKSVDWNYVSEFVPKHKRFGEDRAPTLDEVRKIVQMADLRTKCLILFLCSSGARIGSVAWLKWRDVEEVEWEGRKFAKVTVYRGEPEQYTTFVTPECYSHLGDYRRLRESLGEKVGPQSSVFVRELNKRNPDPTKVEQVSVNHLKNQVGEMLRQMAMRAALDSKGEYAKYEFKQVHGFRKFFKTRMEVAGVKPIITELLMGHAIGVANSYMKPSNEELLQEYSKGVPALTILTPEKENVKSELKKQLMLVAGFKPEEIDKFDFGKTSDEEFQKVVRERLLGVVANNGGRQKIVAMNDIENCITGGWEFVTTLPDNRAIVKLP